MSRSDGGQSPAAGPWGIPQPWTGEWGFECNGTRGRGLVERFKEAKGYRVLRRCREQRDWGTTIDGRTIGLS